MATRTFTERYSLDVQINSSHNAVLWRAIDNSLNRVVCIVLLPHADPRAQNLLAHAKAAAVNSSRNAVAILDIVERDFVTGVRAIEDTEPYLGVVTEWVDGQTIDHILSKNLEPFSVKEALRIFAQATTAVGAMHELGLVHGRLRPRNVYLNDAQEIRVTGFGIDGALFTADGNTKSSDIAGLGDLLFAMVTASWPSGPVGGLPAAEILDNKTLTLPSQQRVGVGEAIDQLYEKTQDGTFKTVDELLHEISITNASTMADLQAAVNRWTAHEVTWHGKDIPKSKRLRTIILAMAITYLFGWAGWQLMTHNFHNAPASLPSNPAQTNSATASSSPSSSISPSPTISSDSWPTRYATPVSATSYDPYGDGQENSDLAKLAIDGLPKTAWVTTTYYSNTLGKKAGVGLLIDLGETTKVAHVDVTFTSPAHGASVFITDSPTPDLASAQVLGTVSNSNKTETFNPETPQNGRYLLIWLTKLARNEFGNYVGGIAEVKVGL
ncbi:MAG: protein kinase [Actinomycetes bacterium]